MAASPEHKHVAVLAFPFATHAGLLLGLVNRLATAAPNVTFSFFSTESSNRLIFSKQTKLDNIIPYDVSDGVPEGYVFAGKPQEDINLFLEVAAEKFKKRVEVAVAKTGRKISCLVADAFLWFTGDLAEEMHVTWLPVWTSGAGSLAMHVYTDLIRQTVGLDGIEGRMDEILKFIPGFSTLRLGDLPGGVVFGNLESPFSMMLHKMGKALPRATAVPMNSFEELDPEIMKELNSTLNKILNIGPFNLTSPPPTSNFSDEHGCISWLDKRNPRSVAYIGFGTVVTPPPNELVALAEALEASATPFLWSLKDNFKNKLPEGFLERTSEIGKIVPWAPQVQILSHNAVGVFINHCGWNSVLESIAAGVPVIGRPFFGDHHINKWMVENVWKIGVGIQGGVFTKDKTAEALEHVLSQDNGKKLSEQIKMYKELALKAVGPSGSSTENFISLLELITS